MSYFTVIEMIEQQFLSRSKTALDYNYHVVIAPTNSDQSALQQYTVEGSYFARDEHHAQELYERLQYRIIAKANRTLTDKSFGLLLDNEDKVKKRHRLMLLRFDKVASLRRGYLMNLKPNGVPLLTLTKRSYLAIKAVISGVQVQNVETLDDTTIPDWGKVYSRSVFGLLLSSMLILISITILVMSLINEALSASLIYGACIGSVTFIMMFIASLKLLLLSRPKVLP